MDERTSGKKLVEASIQGSGIKGESWVPEWVRKFK